MPLPDRLGRLRRVDRIGVGGFATVWRYYDPELRSDVAVKALAENWAERLDVRERFLDEARILRQADSDHVVRVYDLGEADGRPYFVMTYADRGSLADLVEDGEALPLARVADLVTQAGSGLAVLHAHGVVHRDVKPQNLLLRAGGPTGDRLLVADLGVAKALLHASGLTQVVGTPSYMAPEQATGVGVDVRADVHALGAVAYRLLTGQVVREGSMSDLVHASLPPAPSSLAEVAEPVDAVLLRALEPDPDRRFPDVASFVAALRRAVPPPAPSGERDQVTLWQLPDQPAPVAPAVPRGPSAGRDRPGPPWVWAWSLLLLVVGFAAAYVVTRALV